MSASLYLATPLRTRRQYLRLCVATLTTAALSGVLLGGCGSSARQRISAPVVSASREVPVGGQLQLTTTVTGNGSNDVVWTVEQGGGSFSDTVPGLYTAPNTAGTVVVKASLLSDSSKSNTTFLTVIPVVTVSPSVVGAFTNQVINLGAAVSGAAEALTWTVEGGEANGTLTNVTGNSAQYLAPALPGTYIISVATGRVAGTDRVVTGTITVIVQESGGGAVLITPSQLSATVGQRVQLNALIPGAASSAVTWATTGGVVSPSGEFFADVPGDYTVTASSVANPSLAAFVVVRVVAQPTTTPTPTLVVQPNPVGNIITGEGFAFSATLPVAWSVEGGGSISPSGFFVAPTTVPTGPVTVIATPVSGDGSPVRVSVNVVAGTPPPPPPTLSLFPFPNAELFVGETIAFSANLPVTWSVEGGGSISASGAYTAPASVPTPDTVTVRGTPTDSGIAPVTVSVKVKPQPVAPPQTFAVAPNPAPEVEVERTLRFSASRSVTWSIVETGTGASIAPDGTFTAPATVPGTPDGIVTVKADATDPNFVPVQVSVKIIARGSGTGNVNIN